MDLSFLNDYLVLIIVGICLCVGFIFKKLEFANDKYIPMIMGLLGIVLNIWINMSFTPEILLSGMFSGLASTGLHQLFKQLIEKSDE